MAIPNRDQGSRSGESERCAPPKYAGRNEFSPNARRTVSGVLDTCRPAGVEVARAARAASPRRETPLTIVLDVILPIFGLLAFGYGATTFTRVFGEAAAATRSRASYSISRFP